MSNAPRVTEADIESRIVSTEFHILPNTTTTVCILTLDNGWTETGISACVSSENFDKAEGEKWSRLQAFNKLWPLMGFLLKDHLYRNGSTFLSRLVAERDQCTDRLERLNTFINSEAFNGLDQEAQSDLRLQSDVMTQLGFILSKRYEDLTRV